MFGVGFKLKYKICRCNFWGTEKKNSKLCIHQTEEITDEVDQRSGPIQGTKSVKLNYRKKKNDFIWEFWIDLIVIDGQNQKRETKKKQIQIVGRFHGTGDRVIVTNNQNFM